MGHALEMAGDVSGAGAALAGLLLIFMGSIATSFDSYQKTEQKAVLAKYRTRIRFAFEGFALSIFATLIALFSKWTQNDRLAVLALFILFATFVFVVAAALRAVLDVK